MRTATTEGRIEWKVTGNYTAVVSGVEFLIGRETSFVAYEEPGFAVGDSIEAGCGTIRVSSIARVVVAPRTVKLTAKQIKALLDVAATGDAGLPTKDAAGHEAINGNVLWTVGCYRDGLGWITSRQVGTRPSRERRRGRFVATERGIYHYFLTERGKAAAEALRSEGGAR